MASGDVKIVVTVDSAGAVKNIQNFDKALEALGKGTETTKGKSQSFGQQLTSGLIPSFTAATLAANAIQKALGFLKDSFVDSMRAAIESEKVDRALEATLQIVGQAAGGTAGKLQGYASALARQTLYDDEAIKSAQALIIQMRGTTSQIDLLTKGAIGLASVFQMDLQSAARAVAQGFEGNYRQLGMLIPAIREAKTESEKHAAMMDFLAGAYKRAEADVETFGGKIIDIKDAYNELQETAGKFITQNKAVIDSLTGVKEIIIWLDRKAQEQPKDEGLLGKLFGLTAPGALLASVRGIGEAAKQANKEWDESFEGMTASMLQYRKTALDPIPIVIREKFIAPLTESQQAIREEIRWLRMLGGANIWNPIKADFGSLGKIIGGGLESVIDFQETVPGLFENLTAGTKTAAESATGMSDVWESAMLSMTAGLVSFGDANATIWGNVGSIFGNFVKSAIAGMEAMVLKQIWMATMVSKANQVEATSDVAKWWLKILPPPFSFIAAAASMAVVNALFSKLLKFEQGGVFTKPTIAEVGHGTEYVLPEKKLIQIVQMAQVTAPAGASGFGARSLSIAAIHIHVGQMMTATEIRRLGPAIYGAVKDEFRIRGYNLEKH